jgi:hypothetical protein
MGLAALIFPAISPAMAERQPRLPAARPDAIQEFPLPVVAPGLCSVPRDVMPVCDERVAMRFDILDNLGITLARQGREVWLEIAPLIKPAWPDQSGAFSGSRWDLLDPEANRLALYQLDGQVIKVSQKGRAISILCFRNAVIYRGDNFKDGLTRSFACDDFTVEQDGQREFAKLELRTQSSEGSQSLAANELYEWRLK